MKGLLRRARPLSRTRPSRTRRSSSPLMAPAKCAMCNRALKSLGFSRMRTAVAQQRTSCQSLNLSDRSSADRPGRTLAAFILPSVGRVASAPSPHCQTHANIRNHANQCSSQSLRPPLRQSAHEQTVVMRSCRPSQARSTRSTLAADLHPECSNWCSSKHGRTASTSAETMHSTSLAADHQEHLGTTWKRADQQRGPQAPIHLIRHRCCPACRSWARRHSPPTSAPHPRTYCQDGPKSRDTQRWHSGPDRP